MRDADHAWWLGANRTWHRGNPPIGWRRGVDGRWHAPDAPSERTTEEQPAVAGAPWTDLPPVPTDPIGVPSARHLGSRARPVSPRPGSSRRVPDPARWTTIAIPALAAVIVLATVGMILIGSTTSDSAHPDPGPPPGELGALTPSPDLASPATVVTTPSSGAPAEPTRTTEGSSTTGAADATSPAPPPDSATPESAASTTAPPAPIDPLEACSTGQRAVIDRGNHPWDWYIARFDPDGDGIFCT